MPVSLPKLTSDPALAAFVERRGIASHIDATLAMIDAAFNGGARVTLHLKQDPEIEGVEYVKLRVVVAGSIPEVSAAYRKLNSKLVAEIPFEARQYMRVSVTFAR